VRTDDRAGVRDARKRLPGRFAHLRTTMSESDWLAPLPEDELLAWEGRYPANHDKPGS
jgi:hypothetical protein